MYNVRDYYTDPPKMLTLAFRLLRSLNVIETDTDRSATYDFLLTFYIATTDLFCTVFKI